VTHSGADRFEFAGTGLDSSLTGPDVGRRSARLESASLRDPCGRLDPPTTGWLRIDARKSTFSILPKMKSVLVRGFDSLVKRYKGYTISMNFNHGIFPG
jgi:hypothetical protein